MSSKHEPGETTPLDQVLAEATNRMEADEARERDHVADMVESFGDVARLVPPGEPMPMCRNCGRNDRWYRYVVSGKLSCRCEFNQDEEQLSAADLAAGRLDRCEECETPIPLGAHLCDHCRETYDDQYGLL